MEITQLTLFLERRMTNMFVADIIIEDNLVNFGSKPIDLNKNG